MVVSGGCCGGKMGDGMKNSLEGGVIRGNVIDKLSEWRIEKRLFSKCSGSFVSKVSGKRDG